MNEYMNNAVSTPAGIKLNFNLPRAPVQIDTPLKKERLPFTVRLVQNGDDLEKAIQVRQSAYARHVPEFAESLRLPEHADFEDGVVIFLAESKLDGSAIGTIRIQTNQFNSLELEQTIDLPEWLQNRSIAEATRLGVQGKEGRIVRAALSKAYFQYCQQNGIEWMLVTGRAPVDREYDRMQFQEVYPGMGYIPMKHIGNIPHRVLALKVSVGQARWAEKNQPLFNFFFETQHDDIDVTANTWSTSKRIFRAPTLSVNQ